MRILVIGLAAEEEEEVRGFLPSLGGDIVLLHAGTPRECEERLRLDSPALVLAGQRLKGMDAFEVLGMVADLRPGTQVIAVARKGRDAEARDLCANGAFDAFPADQAWRLPMALRRCLEREAHARSARRIQGMEVLLEAVKRLSLARRMEDVVDIVRRSARRLSQADGATFVLRDGNQCHYVDEDAVGPLWKGRKFPLARCISGWAMLNRQAVVVPDIYLDPRIPHDAYRPTFVKSLVMMPIRSEAPIGAIGTYWGRTRQVTEEEVALIQALADSAALAVENVRILADLERRVRDRTASLEGVNRELEAFAYSVSHDLRSPLAVILGYSDMLTDPSRVDLAERDRRMIRDIQASASRMAALIEDLMRLSRVTQREVETGPVDLSAMARQILAGLQAAHPGRKVETAVEDGLTAPADAGLMRIALENLLSNAWKYTSTRDEARIEVGRARHPEHGPAFYVRDDGVGFAMDKARRLFEPFQRLHSSREFPGTGIGLATVSRVLQKHGGRVWAESAPDKGSTFWFALPPAPTALAEPELAGAARR